jgi:peptidoglycan/LPS O-acetylase OafA/YrhL
MPVSARDRRRIGELVAVVNAGAVILWLNVFMTWVNHAFDRFSGDLIGASMLAWPFLVVGASALTLFGSSRRIGRWLALAMVLLMVAVLGDQTVGALRDGNVSGEGLRLGGLMAAEALIALGATLITPAGTG